MPEISFGHKLSFDLVSFDLGVSIKLGGLTAASLFTDGEGAGARN
jgi:hypothetical protein